MKSMYRTRLLASSLLIGSAMLATPSYAQDTQDTPEASPAVAGSNDVLPANDAKETREVQGQSIVVTGSRIRQDAFNSPTPIQVLDVDQAQKLGVSSVTDLLQQTTVASGTQIDATFNSAAGTSNGTEAPPTGGTGSSNIDLRGLGQERSLVLVNGRRLGSAGVRGAPAQPDIGLLPIGLVERVEVVTEGASSIYGADAVAGVVNVILKSEFEGFEINGGIQRPEAIGGDIEQVSLIMGASGDRARIMAGVDYYSRELVTAGDRAFSRSSRAIAEDENGKRYILDANGLFDNTVFAPGVSPAPGYDTAFPIVFYTPGQTNIGVPNFSDYRGLPALPAGARDQCLRTASGSRCYSNYRYFDAYNEQDELRAAPLIQPLQRYSFSINGSYDLAPEHNIQAYFEGFYFNRQQKFSATTEQIYPDIPAMIPVVDDDGFATRDANGDVVMVDNPYNPFNVDVFPILSISQVGQKFTVEVQQHRMVGGIRGDLPGDWFESKNWNFDAYWSYDRSTGFQSQPIIYEPHLFNATQGLYQRLDGSIGCGPIVRLQNGGLFSFEDCVPVDFFAPSIYATGPKDDGSFATQAEYDYLVGNRTNRTVVEQTIYAFGINGDLFKLPYDAGGLVQFALGFEHRDDAIDSQNDLIGVKGLNAAENPSQEGRTVGSRSLNEVYGELSIPLLSDLPFVHTLTVDGAIRYTDESNFGDELTYRARALWRPVSWIQLSGSYGTSYRAPNLREQFLAPQSGGISGGADPCLNTNIQNRVGAASGGDGDPGVVNLINNCIASGVVFTDTDGNGRPDTTTLGNQGITTIAEVKGGNADLDPETSRSYTATFAISPPSLGPVRLDFSTSYFDIRVENSVNELGAESIIGRCYNDETRPNLSSSFCSQIQRATNVPNEIRIIRTVNSGFVNIGYETARGLDFNGRMRVRLSDVSAGLPDASLTIAGTVSYSLERKKKELPEDDVRDLRGTFGFPNLRIQPLVGISYGPWQFLAQGRYIGPQHRETRSTFAPSTIFEGAPVVKAVDYVNDIYYQDVSLTYEADNYSITAGVKNLFDQDPHLIDSGYDFQRNNAFTGSGYDFFGRTFFINTGFKF